MALAERFAAASTSVPESSVCQVAKLKRHLSNEDAEWFASVEHDKQAFATHVVQAINEEYGDGTLEAASLRRHRLLRCKCPRAASK